MKSRTNVFSLKASTAICAALLFCGAGVAVGQPAEPTEPPEDGEAEPTAEPGDPDSKEPSPEQQPKTTNTANSEAPADVDSLRRRYLELRDKLFRSRARAETVASALYSTRIQIKLQHKSGRHYSIGRATIRLDGANVFDDATGKISEGAAIRFEGYVAPGRHRVTIRIEATGKDDDRFVTTTESTFVVVATEGQELHIDARAADEGDIAYRWQRKKSGTLRLRLDVDVKTVKSKRKAKPKKASKNRKTSEKRGRRAAR